MCTGQTESLLLEIEISTNTMEISEVVPQEAWNRSIS